MKNLTKIAFAAVLASMTTSCESFLDINENPNSITTDSLTPNFVLAQALKVTGDNTGNILNTYGSWTAGYWAQAGGVNGFSEERTYTYTALYRQDLWNNTYDNIKDFDIIVQTGPAAGLPYHAAIAKIMKAYNYQTLVDQYGDIPYSAALQGSVNVVPTYDKAEDIYKDLLVKLNEGIAEIKAVPSSVPAVGSEDIVFKGDMKKWIQFANTLKLRLLIRQSFVPALEGYVRDEMSKLQQAATDGFITTDVAVQPGYLQTTGKQNPFWNRYRAVPAGTPSAERQYQSGTQYVIDQYAKNNDSRVSQLYIETPGAAGTYKGLIPGDSNPPVFPLLSRWKDYGGILKGYDAPTPLMLLAEGYFLQSEAKSRGFLTGGDAGAKTDFNSGIRASFIYYYTPAPSQLSTANNNLAKAEPGYTDYLAKNTANPLINWDATGATKLEKIIYQKYLAMNSVTGGEAWNEYRRTGFPKFPASQQSTSTRADKLPVRLLYPQTEVTANSANVPTGINQFTSKIFWDVVD